MKMKLSPSLSKFPGSKGCTGQILWQDVLGGQLE